MGLTDDHVWAGFAAAAMQGILASRRDEPIDSTETEPFGAVAADAAKYADRLLAEYRGRFAEPIDSRDGTPSNDEDDEET